MGLPMDDEAMENLQLESDAMVARPRGTYDFFNDRDRWQFLSKELSQKQELLHQIMRNTRDRDTQLKDAEKESSQLTQELAVNTNHMGRLKEKLRVEELIEEGLTNVPEDIQSLSLAELRIKLVNTALAYKNEQVRNNIFERKLDGARIQLKKREGIIQEISDLQEDNASSQKELDKYERERERETGYARAIE